MLRFRRRGCKIYALSNLLPGTRVTHIKKKPLFKVHLHNCIFYSRHGVYEEEAIVGTSFEVNLSISFEEKEMIHSLKQTINYVEVFDIVKKHFERPRQLLEMLAQEIAEDIYSFDARTRSVEIHIKKLNPPIANFTGSVGITYVKSFSP